MDYEWHRGVNKISLIHKMQYQHKRRNMCCRQHFARTQYYDSTLCSDSLHRRTDAASRKIRILLQQNQLEHKR